MRTIENYQKPIDQLNFHRGHEISEQEESHRARSGCSGTLLYFAYGSNMNTNQMAFRCPDAQVIDTVRLENYRLVFRSNGGGKGVATILPEQGSFVDGVLWRISPKDEQSLDHYEGFPVLYGKETVSVRTSDGKQIPVMAYTMNAPYRDVPALPSWEYLNGIITGCWQHQIDSWPVQKAVENARQTPRRQIPVRKKQNRER